MYKWGRVSQSEEATGARTEWLVLRRWSAASKIEFVFYHADGFGKMAWAELAAAATREAVEDDLQRARGEVGLGEHEVRGWYAWYRHVTLCLLTHAASQVALAGGGRARGGAANLPGDLLGRRRARRRGPRHRSSPGGLSLSEQPNKHPEGGSPP